MAYAKAKYNFSKKEKKGIFQEYDYKWVQFLLNLFSPSSMFRVLLEREYGKNLDGVAAKCDLSYKERQHLQVSVKIFEERLHCIEILSKRGESIQKIQKRFMNKNDEGIEKMVKKILKENKEKAIVPFQSKSAILKKYHIGEEILSDAIELLENGDDRILYKYTYKIGTNGMSKDELLEFFELNEVEYNHRLLQIEEKLTTLIDEVKDNRRKLKEEERKIKKPKKKYKQKIMASTGKKELQVTSDFKENFSDLVYTEFYLNQVLSYRKNVAPKAFILLTELYGKELDEKLNSLYVNKSKVSIIEREIVTIRELLKSKKILNGYYLTNTFLELFQTEENKDNITVESVLRNKKKDTFIYQLFQMIYGKDFNEKQKEVILENSQKQAIKQFVYAVVKTLEREEKSALADTFKEDYGLNRKRKELEQENLELQIKKEKHLQQKAYFLDYFIKDTMSSPKKEEIKRKMNYFIETYIPLNNYGYRVAQKLFGVYLEEERKHVVLNQEERDALKILVSAIRRYLVKQKVVRMRPNYFVDVFTTYDTSIEERKWIANVIPMILESIPKDTKYYQAGAKLYGPTFGEKRANVKLSDLEGNNYSHLIRVVQASLDEKKKNLYFGESINSKTEEQVETGFISIQSVLEKHFDVIEEVLQVEPFKMLMNTVTEIEQELIYLKLVQRKDTSLTDEMISRITNIPLEEIHSYEIMTKNDILNSLNQYIKGRN